MTQTQEPASQVEGQASWTDFVHTGPGTLAGRYLRTFWHPVYRGEELPPGRAKPIRVMSEDLTLYRGEDGTPHLVAFRCAHRGTQLSTGWVEGDNLRCFYHGWVYSPDGQCVEQPAEPEPFCSRIKIKSYPVQEYLGLIFAYLGEGEPSELPRYAILEEDGVRETRVYVRDCNYFQDLENDPVHGAFVHSRRQLGSRPIPLVGVEETEWGMAVHSIFPNGVDRISHRGMPNLNHVKTPPVTAESGFSDTIWWIVPIDDEHENAFGVFLTHLSGEAAQRYQEGRTAWYAAGGGRCEPEIGTAILTGALDFDSIYQRTDLHMATVEDHVSQMGQGPIVDRSDERLGRSDANVILLRRIFEREMRALAEGRPLKRWTWTEELVAEADPTRGPTNRFAGG
jgi:5,5'-dehydrodivanillate O-demethylase oxygenase subunit